MSEICPICQAEITQENVCCPQCGFKLVGTTQRFEPVEIDGKQKADTTDIPFHAALLVVRGPQTGASYELSGDELTIGRSPQCSIFLNDMTVSRMHASLINNEGTYLIRDENSFNGVWVNNQSVEMKTLSSGDFIQIGAFCLMYQENEES